MKEARTWKQNGMFARVYFKQTNQPTNLKTLRFYMRNVNAIKNALKNNAVLS